VAAEALRADEPGLGSGGPPHHGHDLRRPRTGLDVHGMVGLRHHGQKRLWARGSGPAAREARQWRSGGWFVERSTGLGLSRPCSLAATC
jgi:hypothetical protein